MDYDDMLTRSSSSFTLYNKYTSIVGGGEGIAEFENGTVVTFWSKLPK